jgi:hypothetical protein
MQYIYFWGLCGDRNLKGGEKHRLTSKFEKYLSLNALFSSLREMFSTCYEFSLRNVQKHFHELDE